MRTAKIKTQYGSWEEATRNIAAIVNNEPTFTATLTSSATATTVTNSLVGKDSFIGFMPTTANAATDMNSMYISNRDEGAFTISHASNGFTDRIFVYIVAG